MDEGMIAGSSVNKCKTPGRLARVLVGGRRAMPPGRLEGGAPQFVKATLHVD
jgi:hypothetical protein